MTDYADFPYEREFDFENELENMKIDLELSTIESKILHLTTLRIRYLQSPYANYKTYGTSFDKKCELEIELLEKHLKFEPKNSNPTPTINKNPKHENIFCNNGFELFDHILKEYVKPNRGRKADLIYYHRKMFADNYIHQRPIEFFKWFESNYDEVIEQTKTLSEVETPQRNKDYSNALDWFKIQNK